MKSYYLIVSQFVFDKYDSTYKAFYNAFILSLSLHIEIEITFEGVNCVWKEYTKFLSRPHPVPHMH